MLAIRRYVSNLSGKGEIFGVKTPLSSWWRTTTSSPIQFPCFFMQPDIPRSCVNSYLTRKACRSCLLYNIASDVMYVPELLFGLIPALPCNQLQSHGDFLINSRWMENRKKKDASSPSIFVTLRHRSCKATYFKAMWKHFGDLEARSTH